MNTLNSRAHAFIRLALALVAAHFIVIHSALDNWWELLKHDFYYLSLLYSAAIAFALIEYVYRITCLLQKKESTTILTSKRLKKQFYYGFLLAGLLAFFLAAVLFAWKGQNIFDTGYFRKLYVFILLFLLAINLLYLLFYYHGQSVKRAYRLVLPDQAALVSLRAKAMKEKSFALVYCENKSYFMIDFEGHRTLWPFTLEETMAQCTDGHYFQISRSEIVHRAAILSIKRDRDKSASVELVIPFKRKLYTSRRKTVAFIDWVDQFGSATNTARPE